MKVFPAPVPAGGPELADPDVQTGHERHPSGRNGKEPVYKWIYLEKNVGNWKTGFFRLIEHTGKNPSDGITVNALHSAFKAAGSIPLVYNLFIFIIYTYIF